MKMSRKDILLTLLFAVILNMSYTSSAFIEPTRYDLIHYLLDKNRYDATLPPNFYSDNATDVTVQVSIYDLNSHNNLAMEYECTLYLRIMWTDPRLDFSANRTSYDTLKVSSSNIGQVWIPDLYFHHERHAEFHGMLRSNQLIYIHRNGSILFSGRVNIKSHCRMDLKKYPYDEQICTITIQSYAYTAEDIILQWGNPAISTSSPHIETVPESSESTFSSPYADPVGNFSTLNGDVKLTRESSSYEVMYIAPPVILTTLSLNSFLLVEDSFARVTVATGSLSALVMQWAGIYSKLPPVSKLYMLDWWMLFNMIIIALVVLVNAIRYRSSTVGDNDKEKEKKKMCWVLNLCKRLCRCDNKKGDNDKKKPCKQKCLSCIWCCFGHVGVFLVVIYISLASVFIAYCWKQNNNL